MNLDRLLTIISTNTHYDLENNQKIILTELQNLGVQPRNQQKLRQIILKIAKITDNPKTRESYLRSFFRIFQEGIDKDGRGSSIIIEITKKCNKNCTHCYSKFSGQLQEMPDDILDAIVKFARKHFKHIFLTGGEPTLDHRVFTLVENNPDIMFFIFTNGSTMTKDYAKRLSNMGNAIPLLGIDGNSASTHDKFRGEGSYREITNAIENLNNYNVSWGFITLVAETNAQEVLNPAFIEDKIKKGAFIARYLEYLPIGPRPLLECILSGETYYHLEKRKQEIIESGRIYMQELVQSKCRGLLFFTVDGFIKNCFCFHYAKYNVTTGDIGESIDKTREEWISHKWDGECPIYSDPIGFRSHLEKIGWKNMSTIDEPYLIDPKIAQRLKDNYKEFLRIKAERGL